MKFFIVLFAVIATALAAVKYEGPEEPVAIITKEFNLEADGTYGYEYETGNGITVNENGQGGKFAKGSADWTAPDGTHVFLQYTADENGYQPSGSHVPQIPPLIARALEWIKAHPQPENQQ